MEIAVDLDGVVWDIMRIFIDIYNEDYDENEVFENVTKWFHFPQERFEKTYAKTLERLDDYPALNNNISEYLSILMDRYNVKILTQEQNPTEKLKEKLKSFNIIEGIQYLELIRLDRRDSKLNYKFDVYVDDNPKMIEKMKDYPDRILLLYEQPWNKNWDVSDYHNVIKVKDWEEVMIKIYELENER